MMMKTDTQADRETVPGLLLGTRDAGVNEIWPLDSGNSRFSVGDSCSNTVTVTGNSPSLGIAMESYLSIQSWEKPTLSKGIMDGFTEEATFGLSKNVERSLHVGSRSILGRGPSKE